MNRRHFLGAILAFGVAPAVARAEWLMPTRVLVPQLTIARFIGPLPFDWGNMLGMSVELSDGRRMGARMIVGHRLWTPTEEAMLRKTLQGWARRQGVRELAGGKPS